MFGTTLQATSLAIFVLLAGVSHAAAQDKEDEKKEGEKKGDKKKEDEKKKQDESPGSNTDIATKLQNPIADLISVPFQNNFDFGAGPGETTFGYTLNFQPVIPFPLGPHLRLISRTILPMIDQPAIVAGSGRKFGLGDITQSLFLSPKSNGKLTAGVGPAFLIPTATSDRLGSGKFGIGPTAVALLETDGWTAGVLANHLWSVAGSDDRTGVSNTFIQPFLSRTFVYGFSVTVQSETTYDWKAKEWTIPIAAGVSQVIKVSKLPVSIGLFVRYWVDRSPGSPEWALRLPITLVLPGLGTAPQQAQAAQSPHEASRHTGT